jgi:hypothetical protein
MPRRVVAAFLACSVCLAAAASASPSPLAVAVSPADTINLIGASTAATASASIDAPSTATAGDTVTVAVHWQADELRQLFVIDQPSSAGGCPASYAQRSQASSLLSGGHSGSSDSIGDPNQSGTQTYRLVVAKDLTLCAWIASDATAPTDFGPVSAAIQAKPPAPPRTFMGKTSQRLPFAITMQGSTLLRMNFRARYHCPHRAHFTNGSLWNGIYGFALSSQNFGVLQVDNGGRFLTKLDGNRNNMIDIDGALSGKRMRGTFTATARANVLIGGRDRETCRSGRVRWSARRK